MPLFLPLHLLTKTNLSLEIRFYYPEPPSPHTMLGNHLGFYLTQCNIAYWIEKVSSSRFYIKEWMAHFSKISLDCILTFVLLGVDLKKLSLLLFSWITIHHRQSCTKSDAWRTLMRSFSKHLLDHQTWIQLVKKSLDNQALANNITSGTFIEFSARVLKSMENLSTEIIDRTIASLSNQVDALVKARGNRIKY